MPYSNPKEKVTRSLLHSENERQLSVKNIPPCIIVDQRGDWLQTFINDR